MKPFIKYKNYIIHIHRLCHLIHKPYNIYNVLSDLLNLLIKVNTKYLIHINTIKEKVYHFKNNKHLYYTQDYL